MWCGEKGPLLQLAGYSLVDSRIDRGDRRAVAAWGIWPSEQSVVDGAAIVALPLTVCKIAARIARTITVIAVIILGTLTALIAMLTAVALARTCARGAAAVAAVAVVVFAAPPPSPPEALHRRHDLHILLNTCTLG